MKDFDYLERLFHALPLDQIRLASAAVATPREQIEFLGLESLSSESESVSAAYERIAGFLRVEDKDESLPRSLLNRCISHLLLRAWVEDYAEESLLPTIQTMTDALRGRQAVRIPLCTEEAETTWSNALLLSFKVSLISTIFANKDDNPRRFRREYHLSQAARELRIYGFGCGVFEDRIHIDEAEQREIAREIEVHTRLLGAEALLCHLAKALKPSVGSPELHRAPTRRVHSEAKPEDRPIPFNYLFNLAIKNLSQPSRLVSPNVQQSWDCIRKLSSLLAEVRGGLDYNYLPFMLNEPLALMRTLREVTEFDEMYRLRCCPLEVAADFCISFTRAVSCRVSGIDEVYSLPLEGFCAEIKNFAESVSKSYDYSTASFIWEPISREDDLRTKVIDVFCHGDNHLNPDYELPEDIAESSFNSWKKPILSHRDKRAISLPPSCLGYALIEAVVQPLYIRKVSNEHLGYALEDVLFRKCQENGLQVARGFWNNAGQEGECDLVIETDRFILLCEIKKKAYTMRARAGDGLELLKDVTKAFFAAQFQALKAERVLRENGSLLLTDKDGRKYCIGLAGRQIDRIAISMTDWGGIADRNLARNLMQFPFNCKLSAASPERDKVVQEINIAQSGIVDEARCILELMQERERQTWFHMTSWFLVAPAFCYLIEASSSADEFASNYSRLRACTMGTLDFFKEFDEWRRMGASSPDVR